MSVMGYGKVNCLLYRIVRIYFIYLLYLFLFVFYLFNVENKNIQLKVYSKNSFSIKGK